MRTVTVESFGGHIPVKELIVAEAVAAVEIFDKASSPFCIPVTRQC